MENNNNTADEFAPWTDRFGTLVKKFEFADFAAVKSFVTQVMEKADELNHHPEVTFSYNWAEIRTTTHDAENSLTEKDFALTRAIDLI